MAVSPPFAISETLPADSDLISIFPTQEHPFRDTVESWLTFLSDPTTGLLRPTVLPAYVTNWAVQAANAAVNANVFFYDESGIRQGVLYWDRAGDMMSLIAYDDPGNTVRSRIDIKGDTAEVNVTVGALKVGGNAVVDVTYTGTLGIVGTGALNAGSITSGFGAINIGTDALTAGAASFTSMASTGAVSGTTGTFSAGVSGTTGTFSGAISGTSITGSAAVQGTNIISTANIFANSAAGTMNLRPSGPASTTGQMTITAAGNVTAAGDVTASSDRRLKKSISPLNGLWAADMVREVQPMTFLRKKNDQRGIGFIAQDVQGYAPELIQKDARGYLSLAYPNMVAILWKVVQDLQTRLDKLEGK